MVYALLVMRNASFVVEEALFVGGDGGSRTLVQTVNQYAFYMLIFA